MSRHGLAELSLAILNRVDQAAAGEDVETIKAQIAALLVDFGMAMRVVQGTRIDDATASTCGALAHFMTEHEGMLDRFTEWVRTDERFSGDSDAVNSRRIRHLIVHMHNTASPGCPTAMATE